MIFSTYKRNGMKYLVETLNLRRQNIVKYLTWNDFFVVEKYFTQDNEVLNRLLIGFSTNLSKIIEKRIVESFV